jgi:hypothetical protein
MLVRVVATTLVQRPLQEVFDFVSNVENYPRFHSRAVVTWRVNQGPVSVGDRWWAKIRYLGTVRQYEFRVTSFEQDRRFTTWTETGRLPFGSGCEIESAGDAVRVTCIREMRLEGWRILLRPVVALLLQREIDLEAADLRAALPLAAPEPNDQSGTISHSPTSSLP